MCRRSDLENLHDKSTTEPHANYNDAGDSCDIADGQIKDECSATRSCYLHQKCFYGYCVCDRGFVRNDRFCFLAKKFGETCFFAEQCFGYRMDCKPPDNSTTVKRCVCESYHQWDPEQRLCVQMANVSTILASLSGSDNEEAIRKESEMVFSRVMAAAIVVIVMGSLCAFVYVCYGCCLYECFDRWVGMENAKRRSDCGPSCPGVRKPEGTVAISGFR